MAKFLNYDARGFTIDKAPGIGAPMVKPAQFITQITKDGGYFRCLLMDEKTRDELKAMEDAPVTADVIALALALVAFIDAREKAAQ